MGGWLVNCLANLFTAGDVRNRGGGLVKGGWLVSCLANLFTAGDVRLGEGKTKGRASPFPWLQARHRNVCLQRDIRHLSHGYRSDTGMSVCRGTGVTFHMATGATQECLFAEGRASPFTWRQERHRNVCLQRDGRHLSHGDRSDTGMSVCRGTGVTFPMATGATQECLFAEGRASPFTWRQERHRNVCLQRDGRHLSHGYRSDTGMSVCRGTGVTFPMATGATQECLFAEGRASPFPWLQERHRNVCLQRDGRHLSHGYRSDTGMSVCSFTEQRSPRSAL
ncbi:hypothetical protein ACOMHN_055005 [Nucella lapillus]